MKRLWKVEPMGAVKAGARAGTALTNRVNIIFMVIVLRI
jgi:hypothetical protein